MVELEWPARSAFYASGVHVDTLISSPKRSDVEIILLLLLRIRYYYRVRYNIAMTANVVQREPNPKHNSTVVRRVVLRVSYMDLVIHFGTVVY